MLPFTKEGVFVDADFRSAINKLQKRNRQSAKCLPDKHFPERGIDCLNGRHFALVKKPEMPDQVRHDGSEWDDGSGPGHAVISSR